MIEFAGKVAVITGAASGFGLAFARLGASLGMRLVLADIAQSPLEAAARSLAQSGVELIAEQVDVSRAEEVQRLADLAFARFGQVNLLFNNAGVAPVGLVWEHSPADWNWVLGVNVLGVVNGIRSFVPRMIEQGDDSHVVNTASVAGLISPQTMGAYNVSKHAVVALSETLFHDLRTVGARLGVTVLCPAFVPTGIHQSERSRPQALRNEREPTASMRTARAAMSKAVESGRLSADEVARLSFEAIRERRFYLLTHPGILGAVKTRFDDILDQRLPTDPFAHKPRAAPFKA